MNSVGSLLKNTVRSACFDDGTARLGKIKVVEVRQGYRQKIRLHRDGVNCATMGTYGKINDIKCL